MAAIDQGQQKAAQLINDLQDISFTKIGLILFGTWLIILLTRKLLPFLAERGPSQLRLYLLGAVPIIRLVLLVVAITWVIPIVFNITLQNFLFIAGALGVAIGFAFKDYVSSLIAGVVAIFERPYRPGDWVRIGGDYGEVRSVGMRAIEICTPADDIVHVPHDKIWHNNIANSNDGKHTLMCVASFYLQPNHDAGRVRVSLRDVALSSAYLQYDKPVVVMLTETPMGTHYQLKAYPFDMRDQFHFISDLTIRGKLAVADSGATEVQAMPGYVEPGGSAAGG
jgi:small conductance mechanosensitive channel